MIKYEIKKLHAQTSVLLKGIEAKLQESLDVNEKNYKQEIFRLKTIAKRLDSNSKNKKDILSDITLCTTALVDPNISIYAM